MIIIIIIMKIKELYCQHNGIIIDRIDVMAEITQGFTVILCSYLGFLVI